MYNDEYKIIKDFIDWCESNENTEWMGYYQAAERVLKEYYEETKCSGCDRFSFCKDKKDNCNRFISTKI